MAERWYDKNINQTESKLNTNIYGGLSKKEALSRLKKQGENRIYPIRKEAFKSYLKQLLTDFTSILLIITAIIAALFEQSIISAVIIAMIVLNYTIALFTYSKSQKIFERMEEYSNPSAKVLRDGKLYVIKQERLVRGDVIYLSAGDIVPGDARLISSDNLTVLEANLTGESHAAEKDAEFIEFRDIAPARQKNMVFASTIVTGGIGKAVICETGADTLVYNLNKTVRVMSQDKLAVFESIRRYSGIFSLVMLFVLLGIMIAYLFGANPDKTLYETFIIGLTLAVATMSEFYTAFGYIIIGCGVFNLVRRHKDINSGALVKNSQILEKLKDITYLIVPKNGIFSVRYMGIEKIYVDGEWTELKLDGNSDNHLYERILKYAVISTGLYGGINLLKMNLSHENIRTPEEEAILDAAEKSGVYNIELEAQYPVLDHIGINPRSKFETTLVGYSGGYVIALRGEAYKVLDSCSAYCENGKIYPLDYEKRNELKLKVDEMMHNSYRVMAVASKNSSYSTLKRIGSCQSELIFEGLIAIKEPMLSGSALNVSRCRAAGIRIIMMCDDSSINNRFLAQATGVISGDETVLHSSEMSNMKEDLFITNIPLYSVYEELSVSQKRFLVKTLTDSGETVGYMGAGLDDIIVMKESDIGFSKNMIISEKSLRRGMDVTGRNIPIFKKSAKSKDADSGCDALKYLSDIMISEAEQNGGGGFNAVYSALGTAKVIYRNIVRMFKYLMTSQIARLIVMMYAFFSGNDIITPVQILFCGLAVDFLAVIIIAFERPSLDILKFKDESEGFFKKPWKYNIDTWVASLIWGVLTVVMSIILSDVFNFSSQAVCSCVFISMVATQIIVLSETMKDGSLFVRNSLYLNGLQIFVVMMFIALVLLSVFVPSVGRLLNISNADIYTPLIAASVPLAMCIIYEIYKAVLLAVKKHKEKDKGATE